MLGEVAGGFFLSVRQDPPVFTPAMLFMFAPGRRAEAVSVTLSNLPAGWQPASSLLLVSFTTANQGTVPTLEAPNYDALADGPIEIGTFKIFQISGIEPRISVAIHADGWKQTDVENTLRKMCTYEIELI